MNAQYRHSQLGYLMIFIGLITLVAAVFVYAFGPQPLGGILGAIGIFFLAFGYKLTVEISDGYLRFWFGLWLFWKNIPLEKIAYCEPFKGVIFGWGIHWGPGGWLYNVSGMKAVTVVLKSGKKIHIGTDEPIQLIEAINSAIGKRNGDDTPGMWTEVKADYLRRVEQALSAARHPQSFEILAEVGNHLDRRFAELEPQQRTWESFQKIITEMGPPSEYAELVGCADKNSKAALSGKYIAILVMILAIVAAGMIILPKVLTKQKVGMAQRTFVNDPELAGKWVSVDFVKEPNEFNPNKRQRRSDLWLKDIEFKPDGTTNLGWISWTKGSVIENQSEISTEYEIRDTNGTAYLFLPWLSGDVTIRHQKPEYYILRKVSETAPQQQTQNTQTVAAAVESAESWLQLVDEGKYGESWSQAAGYLKKFVNEEQLKTSLEAARKPLGKMLSREVINSTYTTQVPGAPDGQYVIIQFKTSFENKQNALETVTPMLDTDSQWRVSGYYIR
jgi:hypothetical protein